MIFHVKIKTLDEKKMCFLNFLLKKLRVYFMSNNNNNNNNNNNKQTGNVEKSFMIKIFHNIKLIHTNKTH